MYRENDTKDMIRNLQKNVRLLFILCLLLVPTKIFPQCSSCIVINEFSVDPKVGNNGDASATGEFIEFYNKCNTTIDISCFVLCMTDNSSGRRGDCITIPSGTSIAAGGVYVLGGYGTNCTGGVSTCDYPSLTLNFNFHSNATKVWNVATNTFYTTNVNNYIGVLADGGEDLSLFDANGTFLIGVMYAGGAGVSTNNTENIAAISGCAAKSITIPPSGSHTNLGSSCGACGADEGWERNCDGTWSFSAFASQNPGVNNACALTSCILPVELVYFMAKVNTKELVEINWATQSEENASYYIVEKSTDGKIFEVLTKVNASNRQTKEKLNYYAMDNNPATGNNYYRLIQFDINGTATIYQTIAVNIPSGEQINFSVYPNPSNHKITLTIPEPVLGTTIIIYDLTGTIKYETELFNGQTISEIDISAFTKGTYMVRIINQDKQYRQSIIKD